MAPNIKKIIWLPNRPKNPFRWSGWIGRLNVAGILKEQGRENCYVLIVSGLGRRPGDEDAEPPEFDTLDDAMAAADPLLASKLSDLFE